MTRHTLDTPLAHCLPFLTALQHASITPSPPPGVPYLTPSHPRHAAGSPHFLTALHTASPCPPLPFPSQVFRTYNASITLDTLLAEQSPEETVEGKKAEYDRANKEVRSLCVLA